MKETSSNHVLVVGTIFLRIQSLACDRRDTRAGLLVPGLRRAIVRRGTSAAHDHRPTSTMRRLTLRARLALLVFASVLPLVGFNLASGYAVYLADRDRAAREALDL